MTHLHLAIICAFSIELLLQFRCREFLQYYFIFHDRQGASCLFFNIVSFNDKLGCDGEFLCSKAQGFFCNIHRDTFTFKKHSTRHNTCHEIFRSTFTFTHTDFVWFFGNRLIREDTNPNLTLTFHMTGYCLTGSLNLTSSNKTGF